MTLERITVGISKSMGAGRIDAQIRFADVLQLVFPAAVSSYLQFRGWICLEISCDRSSVALASAKPGTREHQFGIDMLRRS